MPSIKFALAASARVAVVVLAFAVPAGNALTAQDADRGDLTLEEAREALRMSRRNLNGEWGGEKGTRLIEAIDVGNVASARSRLKEMASERGGSEPEAVRECHLMIEMMAGRVLPDKSVEVRELAKAVLSDHESRGGRGDEEVYLGAYLYDRHVNDSEKAAGAYREILGRYVEGSRAFSSVERLDSAFASAGGDESLSSEARSSYRRLRRMMVLADVTEIVGPDGSIAPSPTPVDNELLSDLLDADPSPTPAPVLD